MDNLNQIPQLIQKKKIKLNFTDGKYATGRRKNL